jgi:hypothetical protein
MTNEKPQHLLIHFSDFFEVPPAHLDKHGAFNVSLINDLPLFIDPFLLFTSEKPEYQNLHESIIRYLRFLRDQSAGEALPDGLLKAWFMFNEVKQTWLGFSQIGNAGSGLGWGFARALNQNLGRVLSNFGNEAITESSHLEKLCLIREGVGRDNISDFTTHLIKEFLAGYTQEFARTYLKPGQYRSVMVGKVRFNYETRTWRPLRFDLPVIDDDYVLLVPTDILTKDETWISRSDLLSRYDSIANSVDDDQLRAQLNDYLRRALPKNADKKERQSAVSRTILEFPEVIEYYIRDRERHGDEAVSASSKNVREVHFVFVDQVRSLADTLRSETSFYTTPSDTLDEARARLEFLRDVIENKGGHRIFYIDGEPLQREADLQVLYRLTWFATESDVGREVNDGRGPVDFKISRGSRDKTLVEFKLASNSQLKRNLQKQVEIYAKASDAKKKLKAILYFSAEEHARVIGILKELKIESDPNIVLIDARADNKPSGSKA